MFFTFRLISVIFLFVAIGYIFLKLILRQEGYLFSRCECLIISFGLGVGLISIEMFLFSILGLPWRCVDLLFPWAIIAIFKLNKIVPNFRFSFNLRYRLSLWEKLLLGLLILLVLLSFLDNIIFPFTEEDEWSYWGFLAKIFFLEKGIPKEIPIGIRHPLLLPLAEAFLAKSMGRFNEEWVKIFSSLFYLSIIIMFYSILHRDFSRTYSLLFTFLLASIHIFFARSLVNHIDIPFTFYYSASILYFYSWLRNKRIGSYLLISLMMLTFSSWAKVEGVIYYIFFAPIIIYLIQAEEIDKKYKYQILKFVFLPLLVMIVWFFYLKNLRIDYIPTIAVLTSRLKLGLIFSDWAKMELISRYFFKHAIDMKHWHFVWVFLAICLCLSFKKIRKFPLGYVILIVFWQLLSIWILYWLSSPVDIDWLAKNSLFRLLITLIPVSVFIIAVSMHDDLEERIK